MKIFEYKSVIVDQGGWDFISSDRLPELDEVLNKSGDHGWALKSIMPVPHSHKHNDKMVLIFERETQ